MKSEPEAAPKPAQKVAESQMLLDLRDAAIQYTEQDPPKWSCSGDDQKRFYQVNEVRGMLADFAGHMILERTQVNTPIEPAESEREKFEKWAQLHGYYCARDGKDSYGSEMTAGAWECWQAARATPSP